MSAQPAIMTVAHAQVIVPQTSPVAIQSAGPVDLAPAAAEAAPGTPPSLACP